MNEKDKQIKDLSSKVDELTYTITNQKGKKENTEEMYKYKLNQLNSSHKEETK